MVEPERQWTREQMYSTCIKLNSYNKLTNVLGEGDGVAVVADGTEVVEPERQKKCTTPYILYDYTIHTALSMGHTLYKLKMYLYYSMLIYTHK